MHICPLKPLRPSHQDYSHSPLKLLTQKTSDALRSKHYNFDPELPEERRRLILTIVPVDWAGEWLRPVTPNYKLVGPILAGPGKPLPAYLEVRSQCSSLSFACADAVSCDWL